MEVPDEKVSKLTEGIFVGKVISERIFKYKDNDIDMEEALLTWKNKLEKVFPSVSVEGGEKISSPVYNTKDIYVCKNKVARPTVFIPVFPGTNCEYDSMKAFEKAGANVITKVFRNQNAQDMWNLSIHLKRQ